MCNVQLRRENQRNQSLVRPQKRRLRENPLQFYNSRIMQCPIAKSLEQESTSEITDSKKRRKASIFYGLENCERLFKKRTCRENLTVLVTDLTMF